MLRARPISLLHAVGLAFCVLAAGAARAQPEPSTDPILRIATEQHTGVIQAVAASPDGTVIATTGDDKTIRLWRSADGAALDTIRIPIGAGEEGLLYALSFSPSGKFLLAGGVSGRDWGGRNYIYVIRPESGAILTRIPVSGVVRRIAYGAVGGEARIGIALSASTGGGVQVRDASTNTIFQDIDLGGRPTWLEFAPNGDLFVTLSDGQLIAYDGATFEKRAYRLGLGSPAIVRPSPDGRMLAIGYYDRRAVDIFSTETLAGVSTLAGAVYGGEPHLNAVAWRQREGGVELWAGGAFADVNGRAIIRRWTDVTAPETYADISVADDVITALESAPDGAMIFAASDPAWGVIEPDLSLRHSGRRQGPDFRLVYNRLFAVSPDRTQVAFNFEPLGEIGDVVYDIATDRVSINLGDAARRQIVETWRAPSPPEGLQDWRVSERPTFNGLLIRLGLDERSVSADAFGDGFVIGGDRGVYVFGPGGEPRASLRLDAAAFGVLTLDETRFLAAMGDGTLRWFRVEGDRISEDGAFFLARSGPRWLAWLPDGRFIHSSNGGQELAGYHVNRSQTEPADWIEFSQLYRSRYKPDIVRAALLGARPPALDAVAAAPEAPPKVELTAFCPVIGNVTGECADAKLAKRGFAAIEDVASEADTNMRARQMPAGAEAVILRFRVANAEEGLSKIDVFQNQRTTGATTRGFSAVVDEVNPDTGAVTIERRVPLRDGLNVLQVRAYDLAGIYGQSVELELFRPAAGQTERPDLHVLVVGANLYGGYFSDLAYARADAAALAEEVRAAPPSAYGAVTVDHLFGSDATKDKILAAIGAIANSAGENDGIVLYLAGHGLQSEDGLYRYVTPDVSSPEELLTRSLDQESLITAIGEIKAQNMLLMLDTCYSGAFPASAAGTISNETGLMVLSASSTVEEALDGYDGANGVFAHALIKALSGGAAGPTGVVDAATVGAYVRDLVPALANEKNHSQRPQLFIARNSAPFPLTEPGR